MWLNKNIDKGVKTIIWKFMGQTWIEILHILCGYLSNAWNIVHHAELHIHHTNQRDQSARFLIKPWDSCYERMHIFLSIVSNILWFGHGMLSLPTTVRVFELNPNFDHRFVTMFIGIWYQLNIILNIMNWTLLVHIGTSWI